MKTFRIYEFNNKSAFHMTPPASDDEKKDAVEILEITIEHSDTVAYEESVVQQHKDKLTQLESKNIFLDHYIQGLKKISKLKSSEELIAKQKAIAASTPFQQQLEILDFRKIHFTSLYSIQYDLAHIKAWVEAFIKMPRDIESVTLRTCSIIIGDHYAKQITNGIIAIIKHYTPEASTPPVSAQSTENIEPPKENTPLVPTVSTAETETPKETTPTVPPLNTAGIERALSHLFTYDVLHAEDNQGMLQFFANGIKRLYNSHYKKQPYETVIVLLMIFHKFHDEKNYDTKTWAGAASIDLSALKGIEREIFVALLPSPDFQPNDPVEAVLQLSKPIIIRTKDDLMDDQRDREDLKRRNLAAINKEDTEFLNASPKQIYKQ